nr:hypothetical protein [Croceicoccus ponticola]
MLASFAAVALLPAMTGVPPADAQRTIVVALCSGGSIVIPLGQTGTARSTTPCCAKGCRTRRKRPFDRTQ